MAFLPRQGQRQFRHLPKIITFLNIHSPWETKERYVLVCAH
jgi:hypothetical protein